MPQQPARNRRTRAAIEQLESELLLGGKWLPKSQARRQVTSPSVLPTPVPSSHSPSAVSTAPPTSIAAKSDQLAQIARLIAQCQKCVLHRTRTHVVPGEGHAGSRIMFVGEAPGQTEDEQGRPFVGRAGTLLTNIIQAMGLRREDVFIGNVLKCRPPNNRDPLPDEIGACVGYLHEQIAIIEPEIIVALGAHAAHALLGNNTPIGQLRGKIYEYIPGDMAKAIKLIVTYHPAYLLRSYSRENRQRVWEDMQKVLMELQLPVPKKDD